MSSRPEIDGLAARMQERLLPKGGLLYRRGSAADHVFFIVSGRVKQGDQGLTRFTSGDVLGFVDAMRERPHQWDAVATEETLVLVLSVEDWLEFLEDNYEFFREMMFRRVEEMPLEAYGYETHSPFLELVEQELEAPNDDSGTAQFVRSLVSMHACPLFQRATIQAVAQLVRAARAILVANDWAELSGAGRGLFILAEGRAEMRVRYQAESLEMPVGPSSLLGSILPLGETLDEFVVRGAPGGRILFIPQEAFFDVMEDHFDLARSALSYLAAQVEERNRRVQQEQSQTMNEIPSQPRPAPPLHGGPQQG